jgi:hypothetical protein
MNPRPPKEAYQILNGDVFILVLSRCMEGKGKVNVGACTRRTSTEKQGRQEILLMCSDFTLLS